MGRKHSLTLDQYISLCDFNGSEYVSKSGQDYIDALSNIFSLNNANDKPFTVKDIMAQPVLSDFTFSGVSEFKRICTLHVNPMKIKNSHTANWTRQNEKIIPVDFESKGAKYIFEKVLGVAYILTCTINGQEHIIKIGSSRTTFKKRLGSYNCGVVNNWRTASTTNIKMLQSMVTTRKDFNLYLYDYNEPPVEFVWHGIKSVPFATPKLLAVEDILVKQFISCFGQKPLANVQTNATEV